MNMIVLCGNLTRDPELKTSPAGKSFCNFSLAVNDNYGEEERVDFFDVVAFGTRAEAIAKYFTKGRKILVTGRVKIEDYTGTEGVKRRSFKVVADKFEFVNNKNGENSVNEVKNTVDQEKVSSTQVSNSSPVASAPSLDLPF